MNPVGAFDSSHIDSWYAATAGRVEDRPCLTADEDTDFCIVGGGFLGMSAALELAQAGHKVTLLEGGKVGWAASGRNGGQIIGGWRFSYDKLADTLGAEAAQLFLQMTEEGKSLIYERAQRFNIDAEFRPGYISAAMNSRHQRGIDAWMEEARRWKYPHELKKIEGSDVKSYIDSDRYSALLLDSGNGHFHPLKFILGEARAAEQMGVRIYENSPVLDVQGGDSVLVRTAQGTVRARAGILAGNCYLGDAAPSLASRIMPASTYVVATERLGAERAQQLIPGGQAVCDLRHILDYFRVSADHRLLFGGKTLYRGEHPHDIAKQMRADMLKVFPQLSDVAIEYAWGGHIDLSVNRMPHVGEYAPNVLYAQGFSGHGVVNTQIAGRVLVEKLIGDGSRYELWNRLGHHRFPGGTLLRRPGFLLGSIYYYMQDAIDEFLP